ncbi:phosphoribosylformylglycinamidine cyclo-ligase [Quercus suber]|uniref:Phosphoribosylformylglycinamidine cyclo-ligase n=1 Tax=Quercus suber TaxID=58331 RepID=A0AAW0M457_QUESU
MPTTAFGANTELSRCVAGLIRPPSDQNPTPIQRSTRINCAFDRVFNGSQPLRQSTRNHRRRVLSVSTKNSAKESESLTYKEAGVDIDAGSELVRRIAKMAPGIGGFGGLFPLDYKIAIKSSKTVSFSGDSYLVAGTDGVGTKLKLAFESGIHETIGIDLVAMSVNDIITSGAKPLFFLDYFATSHLDVDLAEKVIKGIVDGCQQSDCALLGGENDYAYSVTSNVHFMGFEYLSDCRDARFLCRGEYDLSGFAVGIVKKDSVIDGRDIVAGDVLIGLPSSGVHSNGFSLVRRVLTRSGLSLEHKLPGEDVTLGKALMAPTVIYVKQVLDLISKGGIKGIAHITGGGFTDNIPRVFQKGLVLSSIITLGKSQAGRIEDAEMRRTFNMGIGMVLVVSKEASYRILESGNGAYKAYRIGEVVSGEGVSYH